MPKKKYIVSLTSSERNSLEKLTKKGKTAAYKMNHVRILLKADINQEGGGWTDSRITESLSKIEGVKIQQLFSELKVNEKLRNRSQELGLTPEKVDELLELVEVNARVSSDRLWLSVHL
jgi:hypothetical protein